MMNVVVIQLVPELSSTVSLLSYNFGKEIQYFDMKTCLNVNVKCIYMKKN